MRSEGSHFCLGEHAAFDVRARRGDSSGRGGLARSDLQLARSRTLAWGLGGVWGLTAHVQPELRPLVASSRGYERRWLEKLLCRASRRQLRAPIIGVCNCGIPGWLRNSTTLDFDLRGSVALLWKIVDGDGGSALSSWLEKRRSSVRKQSIIVKTQTAEQQQPRTADA